MRIVLLGASGRIGRHVLEQALDAGHEVTVLVREPSRLTVDPTRVSVVTGTIADAEALDRAVGGAEVVISAIGPDGNRPDQVEKLRNGMQRTIEAMRRHGVQRIVNLSGAGITAPNEGKPLFDRIATRIVRLLSGLAQAEQPTHVGHPGIFIRRI